MISADPSYRWDGQQWWHWTGERWVPAPDADPARAPEPRTNRSEDRADLRTAADAMRFRGKSSRALKQLPHTLGSGEVVEFILAADTAGQSGILALTSSRLTFISNQRPPTTLVDIDLTEISGGLVEAGRMRHSIIISTGSDPVSFDAVDRSAAEALVGLIRARLAGHPLSCVGPASASARPAQSTVSPGDPLEAMAKLNRMLELDLISQQEFDRKKAQILDRL